MTDQPNDPAVTATAHLQPVNERRAMYLRAIVTASRQWYHDTDGRWRLDIRPPLPHERMLIAAAHYTCGDPAFADTVLRAAKTNAPHGVPYDIFDTNIAPLLLVRHADRMASDLALRLRRLVHDGNATPAQGNRRPALRAMGINDNMPTAAAYGLVVGGELTDQPAAVAHGLWILRDYDHLLQRRGIMAEFNSPTYTPLVLLHMANLVEHARHEEARSLAQGIEARLWTDLAARFHPRLGQLAGPYSRAYTNGMVGHFTNLSALLWLLLGDRVPFAPLKLLDPDPRAVVHLLGDAPFNLSQYLWPILADYHIPDQAWQWLHDKPLPFHAAATCEHAFFGEDLPARAGFIDTHLERDFAFGTATTGFATGASTTAYHLVYHRPADDPLATTGTAYAKVLINDDRPGRSARYEATPHRSHSAPKTILYDDTPGPSLPTYGNRGEDYQLIDHGRSFGYLAGSTAVVLSQPAPTLGGTAFDGSLAPRDPIPLQRLGQWMIYPIHFAGDADELIIGGGARPAWAGPVAPHQWIVMRRGRLLTAVLPLAWSTAHGPAAIELCQVNRYQCIRATWYEGRPRTFTRVELSLCFGGWIIEHASLDAYASLADFAIALRQAHLTDTFVSGRWVAYHRAACAHGPALSLELCCSPGALAPQYIAINDNLPAEPRATYGSGPRIAHTTHRAHRELAPLSTPLPPSVGSTIAFATHQPLR